MRLLPVSALAIALLAMLCAWTPQGESIIQAGLNNFDKRPVKAILLIGNSRTYYHGMPSMVPRIMSSEGSPYRYAVTTMAWPGATLEENWNSVDVQRALGRHWDQVILQPESRAQTSDDTKASFSTYGAKLIASARASSSPVAIIVNWGYGETLYAGEPAEMRQQYIQAIKEADRYLARTAGAQLIDTSSVWEQVHAGDPALPLYEDGNHPTTYGSYLSALMIAGFLDAHMIGAETYMPAGLDGKLAGEIRNVVAAQYTLTPFQG